MKMPAMPVGISTRLGQRPLGFGPPNTARNPRNRSESPMKTGEKWGNTKQQTLQTSLLEDSICVNPQLGIRRLPALPQTHELFPNDACPGPARSCGEAGCRAPLPFLPSSRTPCSACCAPTAPPPQKIASRKNNSKIPSANRMHPAASLAPFSQTSLPCLLFPSAAASAPSS